MVKRIDRSVEQIFIFNFKANDIFTESVQRRLPKK